MRRLNVIVIINEPLIIVNALNGNVYIHEEVHETHDGMIKGSLLVLASYVAFNAWFINPSVHETDMKTCLTRRSTHFAC